MDSVTVVSVEPAELMIGGYGAENTASHLCCYLLKTQHHNCVVILLKHGTTNVLLFTENTASHMCCYFTKTQHHTCVVIYRKHSITPVLLFTKRQHHTCVVI